MKVKVSAKQEIYPPAGTITVFLWMAVSINHPFDDIDILTSAGVPLRHQGFIHRHVSHSMSLHERHI